MNPNRKAENKKEREADSTNIRRRNTDKDIEVEATTEIEEADNTQQKNVTKNTKNNQSRSINKVIALKDLKLVEKYIVNRVSPVIQAELFLRVLDS